MRRDRGDDTKYGWPPLPASYLLPSEVPWDDGLCEHAHLWLEAHCTCGRRLYPLRLMAAHLGWHKTLRDVVPRLRCGVCDERPGEMWLIDDPAAGAPGRYGGSAKWRLRVK